MSTSTETPRNVVLVGDATRQLARLPAASVDCVVTSPPDFNLRDYGKSGQIGLEAHVDDWVNALVLVMRGVRRVLKSTGSVALNLGDSYSRHSSYGAPPKSLLLAPERLLIALLDDGWIVRNRVAWVKPNGMPSSVTDRLTCRWELIYMLSAGPRAYFDLDRVRVPHTSARGPSRRPVIGYPPAAAAPPSWGGPLAASNTGLDRLKASGHVGHPLGKNPGDAWTIPVSNFRGEHFATFPEALVQTPLLATCPERTCTACGVPWERERNRRTLGDLHPGCDCKAAWQPGLVLDPFIGSGTVAVVADRHGRDWLGIELNPAFGRIARERIAQARTKNDTGRTSSDARRTRTGATT